MIWRRLFLMMSQGSIVCNLGYWNQFKKNLLCDSVEQTIKHGEGSMMDWSCLRAIGVGSLYKIE
jgi:hypothetical protein